MRRTLFHTKFVGGDGDDPIYTEANGALTAHTENDFKEGFLQHLSANMDRIMQGVPILVDLIEVSELDCAGIGAIMAGHNLVQTVAKGRSIHIIASGDIAHILEIQQMNRVFRIHKSMLDFRKEIQTPGN